MPKLDDFKLERYLAKYEFKCKYAMGCSDPETQTIKELLSLSTTNSSNYETNLNRLLSLGLGYSIPQGSESLRQAILANMYDSDPNLTIDNVLVHVGGQEAIFTTYNAILNAGDEVLVEVPAYQAHFEIPKHLGAVVKPMYLKNVNGGWHLNIDELKSFITYNTKLVVLNSPHNPTGHHYKLEELQRIVEICKKHDIWILVDEVNRFSEHNVKSRLPSICQLYEKGISISVISKSLGLPGLRTGWLCTKDKELIKEVDKVKDYLTITAPGPCELLAEIALNEMDTILKRNVDIYEKNLAAYNQFLRKFSNLFETVVPENGVVMFLQLKVQNFNLEFFTEATDANLDFGTAFSNKLLTEAGVLFSPGSCFDPTNSNLYDNYLRVGFGRKNFVEGLKVFEQFLDDNMDSIIKQ